MSMSDLHYESSRFLDLFHGFPFAYGTDEGGCRWGNVDLDLIGRHLTGEEMIGIYPMVYDPHDKQGGSISWMENDDNNRYYVDMNPDLWMCKWGAIDIDEGEESLVLARNTQTMLEAMDIYSWIEMSRSKGCHVWVFPTDWVRASVIRNAMKAALQLANIEYDAVYPKQDSLAGPPGNYMRLPYGGKRSENRQVMINRDYIPYSLEGFFTTAERTRVPIEALEKASLLYEEPLPIVPDLPPARDYSKEPLMSVDGSRLRGLPSEMFNNGPVPYYKGTGAGKGRHGFLNRFARSMFDAGYNQSDVISWTKDLDSRLSQWWDEGSKFAGRNDCDRQIQRLVQDAERRAQ